MARHRWATGEGTSRPERLERVLNAARVQPEPTSGGAPDAAGTESLLGAAGSIPEEVEAALDAPASGSGTGRERRRRRWAATRRAALLAAGCALAVGGWQFVVTDRGATQVVPIEDPAGEAPKDGVATGAATPAPEQAVSAEAAQGTEAPGGGVVVVHVAGAVHEPGVVEARAGSRVFEVLDQAGGALPEAELTAVNLAAVVQDGQQILIPRAGEPPPAGGGVTAPDSGAGSASGGPGGTLVNINTAEPAELEDLPRVGPVLAGRIVEWRTQHGPFLRPEDLDAVPGIGPAMLESLLPLVVV